MKARFLHALHKWCHEFGTHKAARSLARQWIAHWRVFEQFERAAFTRIAHELEKGVTSAQQVKLLAVLMKL